MDWGTLLATGVGAVFGAGTTVVVDAFRSRRDRDHHELAYRREVCGNYLGAISLATHRLYDIWNNASQSQQERSREAGRVLTESAGYLERQQLLMIAPGLEEQTNTLFGELRHLHFLVAASQRCGEEEWEGAVTRVTVAMDGLRDAMLKDLSRTFRYATKTTLTGRKHNAKPVTAAETPTEPAPETGSAGPDGAQGTPVSGWRELRPAGAATARTAQVGPAAGLRAVSSRSARRGRVVTRRTEDLSKWQQAR